MPDTCWARIKVGNSQILQSGRTISDFIPPHGQELLPVTLYLVIRHHCNLQGTRQRHEVKTRAQFLDTGDVMLCEAVHYEDNSLC